MAAGLGFKTFTTGEVLTAADVNGYLMQGVLVFANAAGRDAAITSPQEGQFAYLKDTNVTTYYTGSAWANLDTTGMTNPMTTTGDMIYSSSGSTPARLGIGTVGQVLTVNSGATAPEWSTAASGSMTQLATGSFSGTNLQLSGISTAYKDLRLVIQDWYMSTDNNLFIQLNNVTTGSYQNIFFRTGTSTVTTDLANSSGYIGVAEQDNANGTSFAMLTIFDYANTNTSKLCQGMGYSFTGAGAHAVGYSMTAMTSGTAAVTEIDIFGSGSPTLTQGTYFLYGVK